MVFIIRPRNHHVGVGQFLFRITFLDVVLSVQAEQITWQPFQLGKTREGIIAKIFVYGVIVGKVGERET